VSGGTKKRESELTKGKRNVGDEEGVRAQWVARLTTEFKS